MGGGRDVAECICCGGGWVGPTYPAGKDTRVVGWSLRGSNQEEMSRVAVGGMVHGYREGPAGAPGVGEGGRQNRAWCEAKTVWVGWGPGRAGRDGVTDFGGQEKRSELCVGLGRGGSRLGGRAGPCPATPLPLAHNAPHANASSRTVFSASTFAPAAMSRSTTGRWPLCDAM